MVRYENECCDCAAPGYPCRGSDCSLRNVPHFYCDECGEETDVFHYEGEELCEDCIVKRVLGNLEPVTAA